MATGEQAQENPSKAAEEAGEASAMGWKGPESPPTLPQVTRHPQWERATGWRQGHQQ